MTYIGEVGGFRGEDAPVARTARTDSGPAPQDSEWQDTHQAQLDALLAHMGYRVSFAVDDRTGRLICRVMDQNSGEVVRQIPADEMLALAAKLDEIVGLMFDRVL